MNIFLSSAFLFGYIMAGTKFLLVVGATPELVYLVALGEPQSYWDVRFLAWTFIQSKCFAMVAQAIAYATIAVLAKMIVLYLVGLIPQQPFISNVISDMIHLLH